MISITIKRSSYWVEPFYNYDKAKILNIEPTSKKLESTFTDWEERPNRPGIKFPVFNFKYLYDEDKNIFKVPIGFGLETLINILKKDGNEVEVVNEDNYYPVRKVDIKVKDGVKPRNDIQADAIRFLIKEANPGKFLSLATGYGKTFCVIYSAYKKQVPFMIISSKLSKQWIEQIKKFLDIDENKIYEIKGQNSINKLMKMKNPKHIFYISSTATLYQRLKIDCDLDKVFSHLGIGVKVFDEAHEFYKTNCEIDCNSNFAETYYLTATPMRSDTKENIRYQKMFATIPIHGVETHYMNKNYKIHMINYNSHPSNLEVQQAMRWKKKMLNAFIYSSQIMNNDKKRIKYFVMIKNFIDRVRKVIDGKIIIVLTTLNQIEGLKNFLELYNFEKLKIARYDSTVKVNERENSKKADIILTTFGIAYAGLDIENLAAVFSLSPFQSPIGTSQLLGRLSRNTRDVYFLDFVDEGYKRMFLQRKNRLKELTPRAKKFYKEIVYDNKLMNYLNQLENKRRNQ